MNKSIPILNYHFFVLVFLLFTSCKEAKIEGQLVGPKTKEEIFTFHVGENTIKAELAILPKERQKGLMFREKMDPGTGMLFIFERPSAQKFWMKNTRLPLDIGYFSPNGTLKEIHGAKPFDLGGVPSKSNNIQFVLELNLHDFRTQKIKIGDRLNLTEIKNAIIARGLDPADYQLNLLF